MARRTALVAVTVLALSTGCSTTDAHRTDVRRAAAPPKVPATSMAPLSVPPDTSTSTTAVPDDTTTTVVPSNGCTNQQASQELDTELVQANGAPGGQTVPGSVYYGVCGTTGYAVARFEPSSPDYASSFQDQGAAPHYFIEMPGEAWKPVADGANFPQHMRDCSTFTQLPQVLRTLWQDCPNG